MKAIVSFVFWAAIGFGAFHMLNYVHDISRTPMAETGKPAMVQQASPVATPR